MSLLTSAVREGMGVRWATHEGDMAFRDFSFPQVQHEFDLTIHDSDLFAATEPLPVREDFAAFLRDGVALAAANSTEKAKSEFIIAPVLLELRRSLGNRFALFSGVEWQVDADRGLNGFCDFILTRGESQHVLEAPVVAIVEAKNDVIRTGLGQCIAAMYAAQLTNQQAQAPIKAVYGVVTTGSAWKFLRLEGSAVTIDVPEYYIDNLSKIMGILREIVGTT
ncbi:MAG: hypothetical protein L0Z62_07680 [Gemmataceae bacterium]|nr:hypothetical protein [Gemmataceae bacterium]